MSDFPFPIFAGYDIDKMEKRQRAPADRNDILNWVNPFVAMDKVREARDASATRPDTESNKPEALPCDVSEVRVEQQATDYANEISETTSPNQVDGSSGEPSELHKEWRFPIVEPSLDELSRIRGKGHWIYEEHLLDGKTYKYWQSEEENQDKADGSFQNFDLDKFLDEAESKKRWLLPNLIALGEAHLLVAKPFVGKTSLAVQLLLCVATGLPFLGLPVEASSAIGLLYEDSRETLAIRVTEIMSALSIERNALKCSQKFIVETRSDRRPKARKIWSEQDKTSRFDDIRQQIIGLKNVKLLVIDTIKSVFDDDIRDGEHVRHFVEAIQELATELNIAIVFIGHENVNGKTAGSQELDNGFRQILRLIKVGDHFVLNSHESNLTADTSSLALIRDRSWNLRPEARERPSRVEPLRETSRDQQLRKKFIDAVDNTPEGLSISKNAKNYAPRFLHSRCGKKLKATEAEFKALMDELLSEGCIGLKRKSPKHPTMIFYVIEKA